MYSNARAGHRDARPGRRGDEHPAAARPDRRPTSPRPPTSPAIPCRPRSQTWTASPYLGRLALCRVRHGTIQRGATVAWCRARRHRHPGQADRAAGDRGAGAGARRERRPGDIIAVAGIDEMTIGETIADAERSPSAAADRGGRAVDLDDARHQHQPAGVAGRLQADRAHDQGPARPGDPRQRVAARARHRAAGHVGGAGPGRDAVRGARRDHAPRGLRAHDRQAPGGHHRRSTASCTSRSSASRSISPRSTPEW